MAAEGHGDAGRLHRRLVAPQLVDPLLLQEEGLLGERRQEPFLLLPGSSCPWLEGYVCPLLPSRSSTRPLAPGRHRVDSLRWPRPDRTSPWEDRPSAETPDEPSQG